MKQVTVRIKGIQGLDGQTETVETVADGTLGVRENRVLLCYTEPETVGQKGIRTSLLYKAPDTVILTRSGALETRMVIEKGHTEVCRYNTGFGELFLDITGESVEGHLTESGGTLKMVYRIDAGGKIVSKNQVEITVKEV